MEWKCDKRGLDIVLFVPSVIFIVCILQEHDHHPRCGNAISYKKLE